MMLIFYFLIHVRSNFVYQNLCQQNDKQVSTEKNTPIQQLIYEQPNFQRYNTPEGPIAYLTENPQELCQTLHRINKELQENDQKQTNKFIITQQNNLEECFSFTDYENGYKITYKKILHKSLFQILRQKKDLKQITQKILKNLKILQQNKLKLDLNLNSIYYDGDIYLTNINYGELSLKGKKFIYLISGLGQILVQLMLKQCISLPHYNSTVEMMVDLGNRFGHDIFQSIGGHELPSHIITKEQVEKNLQNSAFSLMYKLINNIIVNVEDALYHPFLQDTQIQISNQYKKVNNNSVLAQILNKSNSYISVRLEIGNRFEFLRFVPISYKIQEISGQLSYHYRVQGNQFYQSKFNSTKQFQLNLKPTI